MKLGARKFGAATCKLGRTVQVPAHMREQIVELSALHVPIEQRREGFATALLTEICKEADAAGKLLLLHVKPFSDGVMSASQLATFYSRFGFQDIQPDPRLMARMPGSTPRSGLTPVAEATKTH